MATSSGEVISTLTVSIRCTRCIFLFIKMRYWTIRTLNRLRRSLFSFVAGMYGASDVPFVAERIFTKKRTVPFWPGFVWFVRGLDGYVTAASVSIIVAVGGWVPLLLNSQAYRDVVAHQLPDTVALFQRIALVGIIVMVYLSFKLLPPRPERYKRSRTIWMLLQWVLMPLTAIGFLSFAALNAQTRLFFAKYLTKFDVTNKATVASREALKRSAKEETTTRVSELK